MYCIERRPVRSAPSPTRNQRLRRLDTSDAGQGFLGGLVRPSFEEVIEQIENVQEYVCIRQTDGMMTVP
jgi:hypothetical protein